MSIVLLGLRLTTWRIVRSRDHPKVEVRSVVGLLVFTGELREYRAEEGAWNAGV